MKALALFTVMVLGYSMLNMMHSNVRVDTYKDGINAYMEYQANKSFLKPAIVKNK